MQRTFLLSCLPAKIYIPWKAPNPDIWRQRVKDKKTEEKPKYTGKPPPTVAAKANLKQPLGRPSVKSRVMDLRITTSREAHIDFGIHQHKDLRTGLESRDNFPRDNEPSHGETTHFLTIPIQRDGVRSRIENIQEEMLKYDKSLGRMFISPSNACIEYLPLRLVPNDKFDVRYLEKALVRLVEEKCNDVSTLKARILGLKTFQRGKILFAGLTADYGMKRLYEIQQAVLREIFKRKRLEPYAKNRDETQHQKIREAVGSTFTHDSHCWSQIIPQINPFDHFQPHIRIARANYAADEYENLSLLFDIVPYPSYVPFINEFFGDELVSSFELRTATKGEVSPEVVEIARFGGEKTNQSTASDWLRKNTQGGLPMDLLARSEGKAHTFESCGEGL